MPRKVKNMEIKSKQLGDLSVVYSKDNYNKTISRKEEKKAEEQGDALRLQDSFDVKEYKEPDNSEKVSALKAKVENGEKLSYDSREVAKALIEQTAAIR